MVGLTLAASHKRLFVLLTSVPTCQFKSQLFIRSGVLAATVDTDRAESVNSK